MACQDCTLRVLKVSDGGEGGKGGERERTSCAAKGGRGREMEGGREREEGTERVGGHGGGRGREKIPKLHVYM